ncbi:MAG: hypothetical protein AABY09_02050, partial [Nanoarchaeota archaeon]
RTVHYRPKRESVFETIKSFFKAGDSRSRHVRGDDLRVAPKPPKTIADLRKEEDSAMAGIKRVYVSDKDARKSEEEMMHELSRRRKQMASLRKSVPSPLQKGQDPLAALRKRPEEKPGLLASLFENKNPKPIQQSGSYDEKEFMSRIDSIVKGAAADKKPALKEMPKPIQPVSEGDTNEEKELMRRIDSIVKEPIRQKQREDELRSRIADAQGLVRKSNLKEAKRAYEKLKPMFYSLASESQKAVYGELTMLQRQIADLERRAKEDMQTGLEKEQRILLEKMSRLRG